MRIGVACGGTGGHVYPGLATAEVLRARGHDVAVWLAGQGIESAATAGWDGTVVCIAARGLASRLSLKSIGGIVRLLCAARRARRELVARPVDVMLAMGSYASFAPVIAARSLRIPVVLHEANAVPGRAVSLLSRFADVTAITFPSAADHLRGRRVVMTGLPLRGEILPDGARPKDVQDPLTILVMGGSQGAHAVNLAACEALCLLHAEGVPLRVLHLAGKADEGEVTRRYAEVGVAHAVHGYLSDMRKVYACADLAVCRSGAASCVELAAAHIPALFIPLPTARRDHQRLNAEAMASEGWAVVMDQAELNPEHLASRLRALVMDPGALAGMREAAEVANHGNGAERLADLVEHQVTDTD